MNKNEIIKDVALKLNDYFNTYHKAIDKFNNTAITLYTTISSGEFLFVLNNRSLTIFQSKLFFASLLVSILIVAIGMFLKFIYVVYRKQLKDSFLKQAINSIESRNSKDKIINVDATRSINIVLFNLPWVMTLLILIHLLLILLLTSAILF